MKIRKYKSHFISGVWILMCLLMISPIEYSDNSNLYANIDSNEPFAQTPREEILSTDISNPTSLDIDTYYIVKDSADMTFYLQFYLYSGKVYALTRSSSWSDYYLYSDPEYSQEIRSLSSSFVNVIAFAPAESGYYYVKNICSATVERFFGFWEATDLTNLDISVGSTLSLKDPDWGKGVVYFHIDAYTKDCSGWGEIDMECPDPFASFVAISTSSGEAFNTNEMLTNENEFQTEICNTQGGESYIMIHKDRGLLKIETPGDAVLGGDNNFIWIILGVIGAVVLVGILLSAGKSKSKSSYNSNRRSTFSAKPSSTGKSKYYSSNFKKPISSTSGSSTKSTQHQKPIQLKRLKGMISLEKKIDLKEAAKILNTSKTEIKGLIYEMAAEQKITGDFRGEVFYISSGINTFLENLDKIYDDWDGQEKPIKL
ncbi:MAG: hypothetical protein ACTSRK_10290 [Promethearchaeota archaeon]